MRILHSRYVVHADPIDSRFGAGVAGMYISIPVGDDLSVFLFFSAAMVGFGIAAAQESGRKRNMFALLAAFSLVCALFWPFIKAVLPEVAAHISATVGYRATPWLMGIALGFAIGFFVCRSRNNRTAQEIANAVEQDCLTVDFDTKNSTGYYWYDKKEIQTYFPKKTGLAQKVEVDERTYCVRIKNNTSKTLQEVRAYLLHPGFSPNERPFSLSRHTNRLLDVGATDYIEITSVTNQNNTPPEKRPGYRQGYELTIKCPGYRQIKRRLVADTSLSPALILLD